MEYGARLAYLRNERNLSQSELAKKLDVSQSTVGMWESNKRKIPGDKLVEVAEFFNTSVDYILGHKSPDNNDVDLRRLLESGSMTYGGAEISEQNLKVLSRVVQSFLDEVDNE